MVLPVDSGLLVLPVLPVLLPVLPVLLPVDSGLWSLVLRPRGAIGGERMTPPLESLAPPEMIRG